MSHPRPISRSLTGCGASRSGSRNMPYITWYECASTLSVTTSAAQAAVHIVSMCWEQAPHVAR
eukprot:5415347-Prymnesium_polylepis.1